MLQAFPTKNGTGISIFGDYGDLRSLYLTVQKINGCYKSNHEFAKSQEKILLEFSSEISKAYEGKRLKDNIEYLGEDTSVEYLGFQVVWIDILVFIAVLRYQAGRSIIKKIDQANLYLLEHIVENAMFDYDPKGANQIKEFIGKRIPVFEEQILLIYHAAHVEFVKSTKGKQRFRNIPNLFVSFFSSWSNEHKELMADLETIAKNENCKISELRITNFPKIEW